MEPNRITYFAETDARNKRVRFGLKDSDRLRHTYVIGKTGVGKSTLLENMAIQDIQNGNGMAFIDPHGGTAEKLLEYVPENRIKDVIYFAPFDLEYPVSFNVMEDIGADKRHLVVNGLMSTFEKLWVDMWSARMAYILNNTLLALLEYPGATLLGVNRMLSDKEYRKKVVENVKDDSVKAFWIDEFGKWTEKFIAEAIPAIQNKVGQFTANPLVRNLLGQSKSTFDIRKIMDEKKILIINMSKGLVGEGNANLIGSMLITKIYLAAMSRADKSKAELAKLPPFYLYVDEFQSFANKSFADILSEARKYKLSLNIAHQYIEQMEEEVRDAVFGNVGTMITFRVGAFDAEVLEKEFAPVFTAEDLVNLGKYQIYLKLMIDEVSSHPFSAVSIPPISKPEVTYRDQVVESSRSQFARPRAEVEEEIKKWHEEGTNREVRPAPQGGEAPRGYNNNGGGNRGGQGGEQNRTPYQGQSAPVQRSNPSASPVKTPIPVTQPAYVPKPPLTSTSTLQPTTNLIPTPSQDANKLAFMKASEDLKVKVDTNVTTSTTTSTTLSATGSNPRASLGNDSRPPINNINRNTTSLSNLRVDDKKQPSAENISSLKNALADVLAKSNQKDLTALGRPNGLARSAESGSREKTEAKKEEPAKTPEPKPAQGQSLREEEKKTEPKKEEKSRLVGDHPERLEENKDAISSVREVPEKVLRELLK